MVILLKYIKWLLNEDKPFQWICFVSCVYLWLHSSSSYYYIYVKPTPEHTGCSLNMQALRSICHHTASVITEQVIMCCWSKCKYTRGWQPCDAWSLSHCMCVCFVLYWTLVSAGNPEKYSCVCVWSFLQNVLMSVNFWLYVMTGRVTSRNRCLSLSTAGSIRCVSVHSLHQHFTPALLVATAASSSSHSLVIVACRDWAAIEPKLAGLGAAGGELVHADTQTFTALTACQRPFDTHTSLC